MASLKLEHIYKVYPNGHKAVNDISLDIQNGEFIVFVGPSGCGKSTTLRMIAGLEEITAGELYIDSNIVNDMEPKDRDIAMVFQNYALYPHMTVYENMAFGLRLRHFPEDVIQEKVLWAADILGIKDYLDRKPRNMSGGQRQRVALGRSILRDPKVMLLDEPLSNLDAKLRTQMRTEIAKLHKKLKTTFIYVTHDQTEAMTLGDRVVVMKLGRIQQVDTPKNLYDYPSNKFVAGFIGTPQMNFFPCTLLRKGEEVEITLKDNGKTVAVPYNMLIKVLPEFLDGKHDITLGIRCENVSIVNECEEGAIPVRVSHFEELGSECLIYGSISEDDSIESTKGQIIAKVREVNGLEPGQTIYVKFNLEKTYFFDDKTENTIVPRVPVYNSLSANVKDSRLQVLGASLPLPAVLENGDLENAELQVPTDAILLHEEGIHAKVVNFEVVGDVKLAHLEAAGRVFFAQVEEELPVGSELDINFDFTRLTLVYEGNVIFQPLEARDSFAATFYNYETVIAKDPDPDFIAFRDNKINEVKEEMDRKYEEITKAYEAENERLKASDIEGERNKIQQEYQTLVTENNQKIKESNQTTKDEIAKLTQDFKEKKQKATVENNELFAEKKRVEIEEYTAFKAKNKDKDSLKRRTDEYHIFMDNFQTEKNNTLNLQINSMSMDYESKVAALKANNRRTVDILKKEIKEKQKEVKNAQDPIGNLAKNYEKQVRELNKEKAEAIKKAGFVFFFQFANSHYELSSDIISNKLIQGLGTRVFSKQFRIDVPHDGYIFSEKENAFKAIVENNLNFGKVYFVRCRYSDDQGDDKFFFIRSEKEIPVGTELKLEFDVTRSQITETDMNIRLY